MNYALGYTLNLKDIYKGFNFKKLDLTAKQCEQIVGNRHKELIADQVMKKCIQLVLEDVIKNNATFNLPTGKQKAKIKMKKYEQEAFAKGRRNGKWLDIDFLASNFSGYQMMLNFYYKGILREKPIYLNPELKNEITENINNGKQYF